MTEIPDSPLSLHDLEALVEVLTRQGVTEYQRADERQDNELVIAAKRVKANPGVALTVCGIPVRLSENIGLNEIRFIRPGREPLIYDFEVGAEDSHSEAHGG